MKRYIQDKRENGMRNIRKEKMARDERRNKKSKEKNARWKENNTREKQWRSKIETQTLIKSGIEIKREIRKGGSNEQRALLMATLTMKT